MENGATAVEIGGSKFDLTALSEWASDNVWLCLAVVFLLVIYRMLAPGGFAEKLLEYRVKMRELDAKQIDDAKRLADIMSDRNQREQPDLPFAPDDER